MQTHSKLGDSLGNPVAILALAGATALWCVAVTLDVLADLRWESVLWAALSRASLFFSAGLASVAALALSTRRPILRKWARAPFVVPGPAMATMAILLFTAWLAVVVAADTTMPVLALLALIGTTIGFEVQERHSVPLIQLLEAMANTQKGVPSPPLFGGAAPGAGVAMVVTGRNLG